MKKLLMALAACATTLIASAAIKTQEGFEGNSLGSFSGGGEVVDYGTAPSSLTNYPFSSAGLKYCEVDADTSDELTSSAAVGATYFDMYVQFPADASTPSPDIDDQAKIAVYVNSSSNVVVVAGDGNGGHSEIQTGKTIKPGEWARLTIAKVADVYNVYVDGDVVQGSPFTPINGGDPTTAAFTGVGKLDNYVARTTDPFIQSPKAIVDASNNGGEGYASYSEALADVLASGATATITLPGETPTTMDGSAQNPYEIPDLASLKVFQAAIAATNGNDKCYALTADIALDGPWPGIGIQNGKDLVSYDVSKIGQAEAGRRDAAFEAGAFKGTFDGRNHTISGFQIIGKGSNAEGLDYAGFFNSTLDATIQNLKIQYAGSLFAADTTGSTKESGATFVGVAKDSTLRNLTTVAGMVSCSKGFGGIVGYLMGTAVDSCTNNVDMTSLANNKCGGIAMICQKAGCSISNCENNGTMTTGSGEHGGIVGYTDSITISDCNNTAACKMFYHHGGTVTLSGENTGNATVASYTGEATPGLNFATVDGNVATFVADDALVTDGTVTYKVMNASVAYEFAAPGAVALDQAIAQATVTSDRTTLLAPTSTTDGTITTYTVAAGAASVDNVAYETFAAAVVAITGDPEKDDFVTLLADAPTYVLVSGGTQKTLKVRKNGFSIKVTVGDADVYSYSSDGDFTTYVSNHRVVYIAKPDTRTVNYASLQAAIAAAINGDTVILDANGISEDVTLPPGVSFVVANDQNYSGDVTVDNPNLYDINSETVDDTKIYTVVGGTAVASITKEEVKTEYNTIAKALDAAAANDTVVLEADSDENVSLPTGVSFATNGHAYSGKVSAAENGYVAVVDENGVYTAFDNTATVWVGSAGNNNWTDGGNWSTGCAPTDYTDVTIPSENVPDGGWLIYVGGNAKSKSIALLGDTTIQRDADITHNGCLNVQESITTGATPSTLTLNSAFIFAGDSEVSISCPIVCANGNAEKTSGFTSNSTGTFNISGAISGTGTLEFRKAVTLSQDLTVASDGLSVKFEAQPTFSNGAVLKGDGTVVWTVDPASAVRNMLKDANNWTGVCELGSIAINSIDAAYYGNANSTVRFNGVSGFLRYSSGSVTEVGKVMCIDIGTSGLTLNNGFSSGKFGYIIAAKITGSGPMHFGTRHNDTSVGQYFLTGDMSEFTGAIDFGELTGYRPAVIIKTASEANPAVNDFGQIIVAAGRTGEQAPRIASTWDAPGGLVIYGEAKLANGGSITSVNGVAGSGKLVYENFPTAAPKWCGGLTSSGTGRDVPAWTGEVELPATTFTAKTGLNLPAFGFDGATLVLKGINPNGQSVYIGTGATTNVVGTTRLDGDVEFTDGNSGAVYTFANLTGTGNFKHNKSLSTPATIAVTKLSSYSGEIGTGGNSKLTIGTVSVPSFTIGQKMVDLGDNCNLTTSPGAITVEVNGSSIDGHHLFKATDGDLYVIAAQVTVDETTTYFATLEEAAEFALANDAQIAKIDPATPTELPGWSYDNGYFTKLDIAQVGETTYKTLAAAIATGTTDDIVLINDCAETVTLGAGQTIKPGSYAFSGVLKGAGTIYYAAKPTTVSTFEDWTGTFVADWAGAHGTSFPANDYGILGSVVEVRKLGGGYVPLPGSENVDRTVLPTISIPEGCYMKLANGYNGYKTVFTKVTGAGAMTNNTYAVEIATLENFTGSISSDVGTKIVDVVTSTTAAPGACLVKGGSFTDVASMTVNGAAPTYKLEYKGDVEQPGIYYAVAATISDGESVSNCGTVVEALSYAFIRRPSSFGWVVTVLDDEWEDEGTYDEFFTWDPVARTYTVITYPARIGMNHYPSLAAAVSAAQSGDTIVLIADDRVSFTTDNLEIGIDKALTIEGNGYTVYGVSDYAGGAGDHDIYISGSGDVTIKNVTLADFAGDVANNMRTYPIWTGSAYAGTLTLDNVTVQDFNRTAFNLNGGTVVVTNCTITCDSTRDFQEGIGAYLANVTIADTTITGAGSSNENWPKAACIQLGNPNGTVAGTGSITVLSGTFAGQYGIIVASNAQNNVSVQGGNFTGSLLDEEGEAGTISITGGTFSVDPSDYVASGYEAKASDGVWTVAEKSSAPLEPGQSSSETYTTPEAAQVAAESVEIAVPTAVADELDSAAQATYKAMFEAKVVPNGEGGYKVEVALTSAAEEDLQAQANADAAEVVEDLTEAEVTLTTTPGLYYSFEYGTSLQNMTEGARTLATGEKLELARPTTENATSGFYRVLVNVTDK